MNASTTNETVTYDAILASGETLELWLVDGEGNGEWFDGTLADATQLALDSGECVGIWFDGTLLAIASEGRVSPNALAETLGYKVLDRIHSLPEATKPVGPSTFGAALLDAVRRIRPYYVVLGGRRVCSVHGNRVHALDTTAEEADLISAHNALFAW
jgi:hypothetical protein